MRSHLDRYNRECLSTFGNAHTRQFAGDVTNGCSRTGADAPSAAATERVRSITIAHDSVGPPPHRRCPWAPKPSVLIDRPATCSTALGSGREALRTRPPHSTLPTVRPGPPATPWVFSFFTLLHHTECAGPCRVSFFSVLSVVLGLSCRLLLKKFPP